MSSPSALYPASSQSQSAANAEIIPLFVCSGMKDVPFAYALFPHGDGCSSPTPCPARDLCQWYAAHDLGGTLAFNELPEHMLLHGDFQSHPFCCSHFTGQDRPLRKRCRTGKTAGAQVVA